LSCIDHDWHALVQRLVESSCIVRGGTIIIEALSKR
jgi:hypothetical protein